MDHSYSGFAHVVQSPLQCFLSPSSAPLKVACECRLSGHLHFKLAAHYAVEKGISQAVLRTGLRGVREQDNGSGLGNAYTVVNHVAFVVKVDCLEALPVRSGIDV